MTFTGKPEVTLPSPATATAPLVSVVIPTHNRAAMVVEAVRSVLAQTYRPIELIVVDDGSTDGTAGALAPFAGELTLIRREHRGVSAARNAGVAASSGSLVAFLDSDDLWDPAKLAVQVSFLRAFPGAALCHTEEIWLRRGRRVNPRRRHRKAEGRDAFGRLLHESLVSPSALVIRREVLDAAGGFDESLPACEDYDLWLRLARRHEIHLLRRPLVTKRGGHPDQLSRRLWGLDRFRVRVLRRLLDEEALDEGERRRVRAVLAEKCRVLAQGARRRGRGEDAARYLALAEEGAP